MNFAVARVVFGRAKTIPYSLITAGNYETQIMGVKKNKFIVQNMPINPQRYRRVFSVDSKKKKKPIFDPSDRTSRSRRKLVRKSVVPEPRFSRKRLCGVHRRAARRRTADNTDDVTVHYVV